MGKKIVLIGAGSTQFAKRVIGDILWFPDMQIDEIALVDINAYKLGVMKRVAENLVKVTEKKTVITAATDRCQALPVRISLSTPSASAARNGIAGILKLQTTMV